MESEPKSVNLPSFSVLFLWERLWREDFSPTPLALMDWGQVDENEAVHPGPSGPSHPQGSGGTCRRSCLSEASRLYSLDPSPGKWKLLLAALLQIQSPLFPPHVCKGPTFFPCSRFSVFYSLWENISIFICSLWAVCVWIGEKGRGKGVDFIPQRRQGIHL